MAHNIKTAKNSKILSVLFVISPVIISAIILGVYRSSHAELSRLFIKWNDEAAYYSLVKTFLEFGNPLGYWAYDGIHAPVGTGGPWGVVILLPYALFGKIFGWNLSSPVYANILFLGLAFFVFLRCVKPNSADMKWLVLAPYIFIPLILYVTTAMTEPLRFSLVIIMTGQLIALANAKCSRKFSYIITPLTIIFSTQIYIFLAIFVPPYIFLAARKSKPVMKFIYAALASAVVMIPSFFVLKATSCTYSFKDSETIKSYFLDGGFLSGCKNLLSTIYYGFLQFLKIESTDFGGMLVWHTYAYCLLIVISLLAVIFAVVKKKSEKSNTNIILNAMALFILTAFLAANIIFYSSGDQTMTVFRLMSIPMLSALLLLLFSGSRFIKLGVVIVCAIGLICLPKASSALLEGRFVTEDEWAQYDELESRLAEVILIDHSEAEKTEQSRFDYTVAVYMIYSLPPQILCALPAGTGVNMMMGGSFDDQSRYLLFDKNNEISQNVMQENENMLQNDYKIAYETNQFILYVKEMKKQ